MLASPRSRTFSALASPSRIALLDHIREADGPLDAHALSQECNLHVTTVRFHLGALIGAGLLTSHPAPSNGRGRPRLLYSAVTQIADEEDGYQQLARLLITALQSPDGSTAAERAANAGYEWATAALTPEGRDATADEHSTSTDQSAAQVSLPEITGQINALFTQLGFESDYTTGTPAGTGGGENAGGSESTDITLHHCPFGAVAKENPDVVCQIHLGLLRGALDHLGATEHRGEIEPWTTPSTCRATVTPPRR